MALPSEHATPDPQRVRGEIRVQGLLRLAPDTLYEDDVHAAGGLVARPGSIVAGDVYTDGAIQLAPTARIGGRVRPALEPSQAPSAGQLAGLLERAREHRLDEDGLARAVDELEGSLLDDPPDGSWSARQLREDLFARGLSRLAPVTIEGRPEAGFLLRLRRSGDAVEADREALVRLVRGLARTARPSAELHALSSAETPGDVVLLVEP